MNCQVVILTKEPCAGTVKTRLIPSIGPQAAARLHEAMVWETIHRATRSGLPVRVALAGDMESRFANQIREQGVPIEMQAPGDLGARLAHVMRGPERTIALGTDCVLFEPAWLLTAAKARSVSIGPADDGGYWLIAATPRSPDILPTLFGNMEWSTDTVCDATANRLNQLREAIQWLPRSYDVDTPMDLERLRQDPGCPVRIQAVIDAIRPTVR